MEGSLPTCHFILCPWPKSAEITQLCPTPAQATQPSVMGVPLATIGPGERGVMLIIISNIGSPAFKLQRSLLCRISQDPSSSTGSWAEQTRSPHPQMGCCPRSDALTKAGKWGNHPEMVGFLPSCPRSLTYLVSSLKPTLMTGQ